MGAFNKSKVDYWITPNGLTLIGCWTRDGLDFNQIAERIGIDRNTFLKWRKKYPEIADAVAVNKELIDYKVENALLKAALGYTTEETTVTVGAKAVGGEMYQVLKETKTKNVAPNVMACLAWLNNRKHNEWKRNRDNVEQVNAEDQSVTISIVRGDDDTDENGDKVNKEIKIRSRTVNKSGFDPDDPDLWDGFEDEEEEY